MIFSFPHQTVRFAHESIRREAFGNGAAFALDVSCTLHAARLIKKSRTTRKTNIQMTFFLIGILDGKQYRSLTKICHLPRCLQAKRHAK